MTGPTHIDYQATVYRRGQGPEVMETMEQQDAFVATLKVCKARLRQSGLLKYIRTKEEDFT
ncbi:hypothetical protein VP1G_10814 [Cytospora mali]|uniref:Uncharacterized protein n=1 Tax=Cytospora mali TaxID=578113 RepID=A0A194UXN1_CYTMA|nr:hypothetical protein VP1G_10814 [Valsa mali var. pyri (nom. inval.)]